MVNYTMRLPSRSPCSPFPPASYAPPCLRRTWDRTPSKTSSSIWAFASLASKRPTRKSPPLAPQTAWSPSPTTALYLSTPPRCWRSLADAHTLAALAETQPATAASWAYTSHNHGSSPARRGSSRRATRYWISHSAFRTASLGVRTSGTNPGITSRTPMLELQLPWPH
jgi:hypothetical protein